LRYDIYAMMITSEIFLDYLNCKYKAYKKLHGEEETQSEYETLQTELFKDYQTKIVNRIAENNSFYCKEPSLGNYEDLRVGKEILINVSFETDEFISDYLILEKLIGKSKLGSFYYLPMFMCKNEKITNAEKLLFTFNTLILGLIQKKIFVYEKPALPDKKVSIYLDVEGNEANTFHYLIGLVVVENEHEQHYSFWANSQSEEETIIKQFLDICNRHEDYQLFHYGSYERRWMQDIKKKSPNIYDKNVDIIFSHTTNILSFVYSNIYFPTYSNELKEIGNYLGFKWSEERASGIQSLVWRARWEMSKNEELKQKLITYNLEDCLALKAVTEFMYKIITSDAIVPDKLENPNLMWTKDIQSETSYRLSKPKFFFSNFDVINKCAYFEYQREKIFFRTNKNIKKLNKKKTRNIKANYKVNQIIKFSSTLDKCVYCGATKLMKYGKKRKNVIDLKFFKHGVKKWIIQYQAQRYRCFDCHKRDKLPKEFTNITDKYGSSRTHYL